MRRFALSSSVFKAINWEFISLSLSALSLDLISFVCVATSCFVLPSISLVSSSSLSEAFSLSTGSSFVWVSERRTRLVLTNCLRTVGAFRLRGEVQVQENSDGTAFFRSSLLPLRVLMKSYSLKCLEQTLVHFFSWKCIPTSLLIAWIHFFRRTWSSGNVKWETYYHFRQDNLSLCTEAHSSS